MAEVQNEVSRKDEAFQKRMPNPEDLNAMTHESLKAAFAGESQAAEKYMVFAEQAEDEGLPNIAKLFRAISFAETRHARNHLRVMGGVGATADNLKTAFDGESFEIDEMYPAYQEIARLQKNTQASRSVKYALKAEMDHKTMYAEAREIGPEGRRHRRPVRERLPDLRSHGDRRRAGQVPRVRRGEGVLQDVLSPTTSRPTRAGDEQDEGAGGACAPPAPSSSASQRNAGLSRRASQRGHILHLQRRGACPAPVIPDGRRPVTWRRPFSPASLLAAMIAAVALLSLAACGDGNGGGGLYGGGDDGTQATPATSPASGEAVGISGNTFSPATLTVAVGSTVTWTNEDAVPHTVTSTDGPGVDAAVTDTFDSGDLGQGDTFSFTFDEAGTYDYECTIHASMPSMHAQIMVE